MNVLISVRLGAKVEGLHREAKAYLDAVRAVALGQERIAAGMASLFEEGSVAARQARSYKDITELLATHGRQDFDEAYRSTIMDPITRFGILFHETDDLIKKRSAKLLDYDAISTKVRRVTDKPSSDSEKLPRLEAEEQQKRELYEEVNDLLISGIPQLIDNRVSYLDPSLIAACSLQSKLAEDIYRQVEVLSATSISEADIDHTLRDLRKLPLLNM